MTWTDTGQTSGGPITFTAAPPLCPSRTVRASLRTKIPKRAKRLILSLKVSDPVHNARTVTRSVKLHR